jgi:hypothetical protein
MCAGAGGAISPYHPHAGVRHPQKRCRLCPPEEIGRVRSEGLCIDSQIHHLAIRERTGTLVTISSQLSELCEVFLRLPAYSRIPT